MDDSAQITRLSEPMAEFFHAVCGLLSPWSVLYALLMLGTPHSSNYRLNTFGFVSGASLLADTVLTSDTTTS